MSTSFDMRVIPPANRSKGSIAQHMEMWRQSNDIWRVYNPTDKDYIVYFDRAVTNEKYVIPAKDKDVGHGKGMNDVPKYIMDLYLAHLGTDLLSQRSHDEWEKKKLEFREEDRMAMQEKYALKTNDQGAWDEMTKLLVKGVVHRFQSDRTDEDFMPTEAPQRASTPGEDAISRLGLDNVMIEDAKENLINQIS